MQEMKFYKNSESEKLVNDLIVIGFSSGAHLWPITP